jgi:hypothetical protein
MTMPLFFQGDSVGHRNQKMKIILKWILGGYTSLRFVDTWMYRHPAQTSLREAYFILFQWISQLFLQEDPGMGVAKTRRRRRRQSRRWCLERKERTASMKCTTHKQTTVFSIHRGGMLGGG